MLWRFWVNTLLRGRIAILDRSWYTDTIISCGGADKRGCFSFAELPDIVNMEEELADDGRVIIKFFLHITKKEQKKRIEKFQKLHPNFSPDSSRASKKIRDYEGIHSGPEMLISDTDTEKAPWAVIEGNDRRVATVKVFETIIARMDEALLLEKQKAAKTDKKKKQLRASEKSPNPRSWARSISQNRLLKKSTMPGLLIANHAFISSSMPSIKRKFL